MTESCGTVHYNMRNVFTKSTITTTTTKKHHMTSKLNAAHLATQCVTSK